jgi:NAD(P)-dependent dehydrogenase (short-subunit alcohol dehydrogenase family)/acyl carrier protein
VAVPGGAETALLADVLGRALQSGVPEPRLALVNGQVHAARLIPADPIQLGAVGGGVLIAGGFGALGLSVARMAAGQGATDITLMGRSEPDDEARRVIDELTRQGVRIAVVQGDVANSADCAAAVAVAAAKGQAPLRTVFHLAGANADGAFATLTPDAFATTFAGKVNGSLRLAEAVAEADVDLDAFVLFSSVASVLGSAGQANYAAANGYLNGLAAQLRTRGVPAVAVAFGPWEPAHEDGGKSGMAGNAAVRAAAARMGVRALTDQEAAPLVAAALGSGYSQLVAVALDVPRYAAAVAGTTRSALVAELTGEVAAPIATSTRDSGPASGWLRDQLHGASSAERDIELSANIRELLAAALGADDGIDDTIGFADLGLDSIMAIDLRTRLAYALGVDLPATVAFDYPTVRSLASYVSDLLFPATDPDPDDDSDEISLEDLVRAVRNDLAKEF